MRTKPLLHPVVAALERQEAINRYLLEQINQLRKDMGYDPLSAEYVSGIIDGGNTSTSLDSGGCQKVDSQIGKHTIEISKMEQEQAALQTKYISPQQTPPSDTIKEAKQPESSNIEKKYAETLEAVDGGLELGCDDYYLSDEESEYVFEVKEDTANFYLNPAKADVLLRMAQRSSWAKVTKIESGAIPELGSNQKYEIEILSPGIAKLVDEYWIIETPVTIAISVK